MAVETIRTRSVDTRSPIEHTRFTAVAAFVAYIPPEVLNTPLTVEFSADFRYQHQDWEIMTLGIVRQKGEPLIKTEMLRQIPVENALRAALKAVPGLVTDATGRDFRELWQDMKPELETARSDGPTATNLAMVAELYRVARVLHEPPLTMIESSFGLPNRTASHWVKLARERGHLERSDAGQR